MRKLLAVSSVLALAAVALVVYGSPVVATPAGPTDGPEATAGSVAWNVDPNHTEVNFSVNHFFTPVSGSFEDFEVASFKASTTLDRGDFGVGTGSWAATLVVGGQVDVEILVEANR